MNVGREHIESDAPPERIGGAVFGERLDKHKERTDRVVAGEQRCKDPAQPQPEACAEDRAALLKACGNVQHGIFEHGHQKREYVQAHHQHKSAKAEKALRPRARGGKKLLKEPPFLHEQNPAHRRDIRRRHERNHKDDVQPAVRRQPGTRQQIGGRNGDDRGAQHNAHAKP